MNIGLALRNMGPLATGATLTRLAEAAEHADLESLWVTDHLAIPPAESEGSGGRYLDPLATLAFLGARTERIRLGTAVLILPYRPALPTAKWVATVQELCGGRLELGVGVGWMEAEFRALGLDQRRRGASSDEVLDTLNRCFAADEVELHGQSFLFRPRPARPPIHVGGAAPHALRRAVRYGDGWLPVRISPARLAPAARELQSRADAAGRARLQITVMCALPLAARTAARERVLAYGEAGADRVIHAAGYAAESEARSQIAALAELRA